MKSLPTVTAVIITYNRPKEIRRTLSGLWENLYYTGDFRFLIADDKTPGNYLQELEKWFRGNIPGEIQTISTLNNGGWGANANYALDFAQNNILLFLEDDYVLTSPIDITPYVALLMAHEGIGLVRLDGIGGHKIVAHVNETDIADYLPDYRQGVGLPGKLNYFLADRTSRETWLYSNRPHLKHSRFHSFYGQYPEGLKLGATEESFAHAVKDKMSLPGAPAIAIPLDANSYFDHVGQSYQHSEFDKGTK